MRVKTKQVEAVCLKPSILLDDTNLNFVWSEELALDLLEARELIKEMRECIAINVVQRTGCNCEYCTKERELMERTSEYAE